jgi:transcriptional regulator with XRE-family HTH domain
MPRITTSKHPLVLVRRACSLSRKDIAAMAGITVAMVQHIELGRSRLSRSAALRIEANTGCLASSLVDKSSKPTTAKGVLFTSESHRHWLNHTPTPKEVERAFDNLSRGLKNVLEAASAGPAFCSTVSSLQGLIRSVAISVGAKVGEMAEDLPRSP